MQEAGRTAGALQDRGHHREGDPLRAAAARQLERQVRDGRRRRLRRQRAEHRADLDDARRHRARARLRHRRHRHRPPGHGHRRELGPEQPRARAQLRPSRRAPHRRGVEGDRQAVLRQGRRALVLHRLLARRRPGHDGVAALSRRLRRHRRRRARLQLAGHRRRVPADPAEDLPRSGQPRVAGHHQRQPRAARRRRSSPRATSWTASRIGCSTIRAAASSIPPSCRAAPTTRAATIA